ncbi:MAG: AAA family ATPase, partial [Rhizobiales bacterium]|nr:AAA family ATPase [Hyphomicrobiales bacterium]
MTAARLRKLTLTNFRSYRMLSLALGEQPVVLVGANGVGKTNVLEAISFLSPGRGLRRATLDEAAFAEGDGSWAVAAEVEGGLGLARLGTGIAASANREAEGQGRRVRIDGEPATSAAAFADHLNVVWLVPAMDGLFAGPASERRRFVDRLALAIDPGHSGRVNALERSLRARNR